MPDLHCVDNPETGDMIVVPGTGVIEVDRTEDNGARVFGRTVGNAPIEATRADLGSWPKATPEDIVKAWLADRHKAEEHIVIDIHGRTCLSAGVVLGTVTKSIGVERDGQWVNRVWVTDVNGERWRGFYPQSSDGRGVRLLVP